MLLFTRIWAAAIFVVLAIVVIWIERTYSFVEELVADNPSSITYQFQTTMGCPNGRMEVIRRHFEDTKLEFLQGADRLIICDDDPLKTTARSAPRDIANAFPGCLVHFAGSLSMVRISTAVCALPNNSGYVCDGRAGSTNPGAIALGRQSDAVASCDASFLARFGF